MQRRCVDAARLPLDDRSCDLAIAFMSLQDVDDLDGVVGELARVLMDGAPVCIAIVHPLSSSGKFADESAASPFVIQGSYLSDLPYADVVSRNGLGMTFHSRHRPLETYSRTLEAAGFSIEAIREPAVPAEIAQSERTKRWRRIPLFMHLRARARRGAGSPAATPPSSSR